MDVARGEWVEKELTTFIEKRDKQRRRAEGERRTEEAFAESERRYNARQREELRAARVEYHRGQAVRLRGVLEALIAHHEGETEKLIEARSEGAA